MIKTTASILACAAALCFMTPAHGQIGTTADLVTADLCDKGDKEKGKEKPAESDIRIDMCKGDKDKDKGKEKPA